MIRFVSDAALLLSVYDIGPILEPIGAIARWTHAAVQFVCIHTIGWDAILLPVRKADLCTYKVHHASR